MEQKGVLIKNEKHKTEIKQYEDLMSSINFTYLISDYSLKAMKNMPNRYL